MIIDNQKWADIIAETEAKIARWNARAAERGVNDTFRFYVTEDPMNAGGISIIVTEHYSNHNLVEVKALARENKTGEVRVTRAHTSKGRVCYFKTHPDPKAWRQLAEANAKQIVNKTKLLDFFMVVSSRMTGVTSVAS